MATVSTLMNHAVLMIDDMENIADYGTSYLPFVSQVISELVQNNIGICESVYTETVDTSFVQDYTPTDTTKKPLPLPVGIVSEDQIIAIEHNRYTENLRFPFDTDSGKYYLLMPSDYSGDITIRYRPHTEFATLTDTLPISDDAVRSVASWGLAKLLSLSEAPNMTDGFDAEYEKAKARWPRRNVYSVELIQDVYGICDT